MSKRSRTGYRRTIGKRYTEADRLEKRIILLAYVAFWVVYLPYLFKDVLNRGSVETSTESG